MNATPSNPMESELLQSVRGLTAAVNALDATLKDEYPKRAEVRRGLMQLALLTIAGLVGSSLVTISVISGCFLNPRVNEGHPVVACRILPGYTESVARNQKLLQQFNKLLVQIEENRRQIKRLNREAGIK